MTARPGTARFSALACARSTTDGEKGAAMAFRFVPEQTRARRGKRRGGRGEGLPALALLAIVSVLSAAVAGALRNRPS